MYLDTTGVRWNLLLCAIGLMSIFLFGCDLSSPASEEPGEEPDGTTLPNGLTITPIPDGGRLTAPSSKQGNASEASPYGCMLSTPNLGGDATYRYDAVYLHFPASIVNNAEGLRHITFGALSHTAYSDEIRDQPIIMRLDQCRVPDSDAAEAMAREYLRRFPAPSDDVQWTGATVGNPNKSLFLPDSRKGYQCLNYEIESIICVGPFNGNPEVCTVEVTCTQWVYIDDGDNGEGDSGSGSGDDPVACNPDGGPTDQICIEGGGAVPDDPVFIENPCDRPDPPAYCSESGSCFDKTIADEYDRALIRSLEDKGILTELWQKSNADASDQSQREERGGWIVQQDDGSYDLVEYHEVENDITYTPIGIRGISTGARPSGTVATFHTQPFMPAEIITDTEVIEQYLTKKGIDPDNYDYDLEELADPYAGKIFRYPSEPSETDFGAADTLSMKGYLIDKSILYSYDYVNGVDTEISRCGY